MNFNEVVEKRYSVRKYSEKKVEKEKINEILRTAHLAPSAANKQPVRVIVVQEEAGLGILAKAAKTYNVPLAFVVCADRDVAWTRDFDGKNHADIDAAILTDHMMLKATELGLGSVWICRFDPAVIREGFELSDNLEPINILAVGYADEASIPSKNHTDRRKMEEYIYYEKLK